MFEQVMNFLNNPVVLLVITALLTYIIKTLWVKQPAWMELASQYAGDIIAAVKFAEKAIPDTVEQKGLKRLDEAMKYMITVYEATTKMPVTEAVKADLRQAIITTHNELELNGQLEKVPA